MDTPDFLASNLFKRACNACFSQEFIEFIGIIDVLRSLCHTENRRLLRQMAGRKQGVTGFIGGDGTAIVRIVLAVYAVILPVTIVGCPAPCNHVDGVVVEQFQLRSKLRDIVPGAGCH